MGPLVPDIIGANLNFVVAIFIGIAFGWILEQAGFSTSKKLVGLFYGYDFTVLRVFFTAGVVAMAGVIALQHYGMLDIKLTYINPTFIWSAIVGGLIMGLGFVIGGFCPGTSICAAAIGKKDAMIFVAGSILGVLVFAEGYPLFEGLYKSGNWGSPQIFETTGIAKPVFVFLLAGIALLAFWAVSLVEAKANKQQVVPFQVTRVSSTVAMAGILMAISGFLYPTQKDAMLERAQSEVEDASTPLPMMTADELAFRILDNDPHLQIVDFRSQADMRRQPLPNAVAFTADNLFEKEPRRLLAKRRTVNLFVASDDATERQMAVVARDLGLKNIYVLQGGLKEFEATILHFDSTRTPATRQEVDTFRFRKRASLALPGVIAASAATGPVKKTIKRAIGGC